MSENNGSRYEFGQFCLEPGEQRLLRDDEPVPLAPKVLDTLTALVQHSGHILTKDELLSIVWKDTFVEESSLTRNISLLRKALREQDGEKYIETVPKRGYRFVAPVTVVNGERLEEHVTPPPASIQRIDPASEILSGQANQTSVNRGRFRMRWVGIVVAALIVNVFVAGYAWRAFRIAKPSARVNQPAVTSLAVLPFKVIGEGEDSNFLGLGMADAIIMRLSDGTAGQVRPTSAISKYAARDFDVLKAGQELGVDVVLEGTVQRLGEQARVTTTLWDAHDGHHIWSGKFDERFADIFALQDSISRQVAARINVGVAFQNGKRRQTNDVEAYRQYAMGYYFSSKPEKTNLGKAINYFNQAVTQDPNYALAYSALADSYLLDAYYGFCNVPLQQAYDGARTAAAKALELDPNLPEANIAGGMVKDFEGDLAAAEKFFERAIELNPASSTARLRYSHVLALTSRLDKAISELQIAERNDPISPRLWLALGRYHLLLGRYDEAIKYNRLALELDPKSHVARANLAWAYAGKAMYPEALAELNALRQDANSCAFGPTGLAYLAARKGELREARAQLDETGKMFADQLEIPPTEIALQTARVLCVLGEKEAALRWLRRAADSGRLQAYELEYSSELSSLKSDSRFAKIIEEVRNMRPPVNMS